LVSSCCSCHEVSVNPEEVFIVLRDSGGESGAPHVYGLGEISTKKSRKKPDVVTKPVLAGLATLQRIHSPSPPLCDWDCLL